MVGDLPISRRKLEGECHAQCVCQSLVRRRDRNRQRVVAAKQKPYGPPLSPWRAYVCVLWMDVQFQLTRRKTRRSILEINHAPLQCMFRSDGCAVPDQLDGDCSFILSLSCQITLSDLSAIVHSRRGASKRECLNGSPEPKRNPTYKGGSRRGRGVETASVTIFRPGRAGQQKQAVAAKIGGERMIFFFFFAFPPRLRERGGGLVCLLASISV